MTDLHNQMQELREIAQECEEALRKHLPGGFYVTRDKVHVEVFNDDTKIEIECQEKRLLILYQREEVEVITYDDHTPEDIAIITLRQVLRRVR